MKIYVEEYKRFIFKLRQSNISVKLGVLSYILSNRKQRVVFHGKNSYLTIVYTEIPQISILGSLYFYMI